MRRNKELSNNIKQIFEKLGFKRIDTITNPKTNELIEMDNAYYGNAETGKIYYVYKRNKLKEMSENTRRNKYCNVTLSDGRGHRFGKLVHKVILDLFTPKEEGKNLGHHKNRNTHDNRLGNLERATYQYNAQEREKAKREELTAYDK